MTDDTGLQGVDSTTGRSDVVDLARAVYAHAGAMDIHALGEMCADDIVMTLPFAPQGWAATHRGKEAVVAFQRRAARSFGSFTMTVERILAANGDTAVVEAHSVGTTQNGRRYENRYCTILEFDRAGLIVLWTEYYDPRAVLDAFGPRDER